MSFAQTLTNLEQFITKHNWRDELNLDTCQGFITALACANYSAAINSWIIHLFDNEQVFYKHPARSGLEQLLLELKTKAFNCLLGEDIEGLLSDEVGEDWCIGFVASMYFVCEKASEDFELQVAKLLFPIAFGANLYEDDSDLAEIAASEQQSSAILAKIPDCVVDLFLLFNNVS